MGVLISFFAYTRQMEGALRQDAAAISRIYARVIQSAGGGWTDEAELAVLREIHNLRVPVVLTDTIGTPLFVANLPFEADLSTADDIERVQRFVAELAEQNLPTEVAAREVAPDRWLTGMRIYYGESLFLRRLKWIPVLQAAMLAAMALAGAWVIRTSFRVERERIWSAMARESAHQMGTPLSSLSGWLELLADGPSERIGGAELVTEMEADLERLRKVSRRFELIGRPPSLRGIDVGEILERLRRYFVVRLPRGARKVEFSIDVAEAPLIRGNETLIEWAFENLIKNSLDALAGQEGRIVIDYVRSSEDRATFRVSDSGPGVSPAVRKNLFDIGVTTKETGWGVGLSLTRRIITTMHRGTIALEDSEQGASFRIELPVQRNGSDGDRA